MASRVQVNGSKVGRKKKKRVREMMRDKVKDSYEHTRDPRIELKALTRVNYELFLSKVSLCGCY